MNSSFAQEEANGADKSTSDTSVVDERRGPRPVDAQTQDVAPAPAIAPGTGDAGPERLRTTDGPDHPAEAP